MLKNNLLFIFYLFICLFMCLFIVFVYLFIYLFVCLFSASVVADAGGKGTTKGKDKKGKEKKGGSAPDQEVRNLQQTT